MDKSRGTATEKLKQLLNLTPLKTWDCKESTLA